MTRIVLDLQSNSITLPAEEENGHEDNNSDEDKNQFIGSSLPNIENLKVSVLRKTPFTFNREPCIEVPYELISPPPEY